jgi:CBS domain containing-hemolysin-like protein
MFKKDDEQGMTEDELISIIEEAEEEGDIDKEESTLIKSAIEFNDLEVGDIYTPRIDITAVPFNATRADVAEIFSESGYSRIPVYEGDLDNIVGILYYKDFYNKKFAKLDEIIKPVIYVAKSQKINELLKELQNKQLHLAVVMDEYGSTAGIVTLEDILEEIVGEIWDEHDEKIEEFKEVGEKEYIATGKANLLKVLDSLDIEPEEEPDVHTVIGWAMTEHGKIPEEGDEFESFGLHVKVLKMDGRRVENIHITDVRPTSDEDEDTSEDENDKKEKEALEK